MAKTFVIDPTFDVGTKGPQTIGVMVSSATHPATGIASVGGVQRAVHLTGAGAYAAGEQVVIVEKASGTWAIKRSGSYYKSRRWVPLKEWTPTAAASRAILYLLRDAVRVNDYEVVTITGVGGSLVSRSAVATFENGTTKTLPIVYAGNYASCYPGRNLAMRKDDGSYEIIGGVAAPMVMLITSGETADTDNPDIAGFEWTIASGYTREFLATLAAGMLPRSIEVYSPDWIVSFDPIGVAPDYQQDMRILWKGETPGGSGSLPVALYFAVTDASGLRLSASGTVHIDYDS